MKIWVKLLKDQKITRSGTYTMKKYLNAENYDEILREICMDLDVSKPLGLKSHFRHFYDFNTVKYKADDFVESVDFDCMVLESYE
ncbi:MAG TPA: hypothetical protein IAC70_02890 [Candidatus Faecicola pullistercoris]|nr:hypothetical protein [Candidatus Faecicola pullistercoris]